MERKVEFLYFPSICIVNCHELKEKDLQAVKEVGGIILCYHNDSFYYYAPGSKYYNSFRRFIKLIREAKSVKRLDRKILTKLNEKTK